MGTCDPNHPCEDCRGRAAAASQVHAARGLAQPGDIRRITSGPFKGRVYQKLVGGGWRRLVAQERREAGR